MKQCDGRTTTDRKCRNFASPGHRSCHLHRGFLDGTRALLTVAGATAGHFVLPGAGTFVGALATNVLDRVALLQREKKRVFVSFDFDNDKNLKDSLIAQSKLERSPFTVFDHSLLEAAPEPDWKKYASVKIRQSDIVIVVVGNQTYRAPGVLAEVGMARRHGVPCIQLYGQKHADCRKVPKAGRRVAWTWNKLDYFLG
jgi:hypothetical protein